MKSNLKRLRKEADLNQRELADMAGVVPSQVLRMEKDDSNPTIDSATKVADALGLYIHDIWTK